MKRKILSVLFALVLVCSFSLVTAVPVAAVDPSSTFTVTDGTYTTTKVDDENGDIAAALTGTWDSAVIGDFTATGEGGLYVVMDEPRWGTTATISVSGTLSAEGITFSGTTVRTEGDPITDDAVTGIAGTITIPPDGAFVAALTGTVFAGTPDELPITIDISGSMVRSITNERTGESFFTIQAAIDAPETIDGDTITVAAGTYNENVVIDKTLTLEGANPGIPVTEERGPESIINAQGVPIAVLINGADTVATFDGFTVDNYDTIGVLAGAFKDTLQEVPLGDDPITVHILNNIVMPPTVAPPHNNNIQMGAGTTGTVIGNEVSGALLESPDWSGSGILVASSNNIVISYNYVHNSEGGIQILGYVEYQGRPPAEDNVIENNLVEGNESGISVQGNSIGTIIKYNDVMNNDVGIESMAYDLSWPEHSTPSGTEVHYNDIVDNEYGVKSVIAGSDTGNVLAEEVDATKN